MNKEIVKKFFPKMVSRFEKGLCTICKKKINPDLEFQDELSRKEYNISGMCQDCQDKTFNNKL